MVCKACQKNSRSHYMHVVGHDGQGRPIIYSCLVGASSHAHLPVAATRCLPCPPGCMGCLGCRMECAMPAWVWEQQEEGQQKGRLGPCKVPANQ